MTRGSERWDNRDLRETFPLPSERKSEPRFDGLYRDSDADDVRFERDGRCCGTARRAYDMFMDKSFAFRQGVTTVRERSAAPRSTSYAPRPQNRDSRSQIVLAFTPDA